MTDAPSPADFRFSRNLEVRFRDLDGMDHVNNAVFLTYFEQGRVGYYRALGLEPGPGTAATRRYPFILGEVRCRFLSPLLFGETPRVHLRTTRIGSKSFTFQYLITVDEDGRAVATGDSTQVYYDYDAMRSVPVPRHVRDTIAAFETPPPS
ncbi:MAG: thioesterase family protein [Pseudomonadota bacterium]